MILAVNKTGSIGLNGGVPWHCPEDLKNFKQLTMNKRVLVGRVTAESLPPLPGREITVISTSGMSLLTAARLYPDACIIGGAQLYRSAMAAKLIDVIHLSIIDDRTVGDTFMNINNFKEDYILVKEERRRGYLYQQWNRRNYTYA